MTCIAPNPRKALVGTLLVKTASDRDVDIGDAVGTAGQHGGREDDPCAQVRVRTGVTDDLAPAEP